MKRKLKTSMLVVVIVLLVMGTTVEAKKFSLGIEFGYFAPGGDMFKTLYSSGGFTYGANAAFELFENVSIQGAVDFYKTDGVTEITGEGVTMKLTNFRLGLFYHLSKGGFAPKIGAGAAMTSVKEDDPFGGFSDAAVGWFVGAGVDIPLFGNFLAGLELIYNSAKLEGDFGKEETGGISLLLNFKLEI
ncbi:MAG: outer membrane beta-barrel protein [Candidatus Aminicenantes bacterium]|nr:outer membrane beta-barrel protein [Candidatus Aminicenantes bacterium]